MKGEDDQVNEIRERFEGINQVLRKILDPNGINALGEQRNPCYASRRDIFCPLGLSRHDDGPSDGPSTAPLCDLAYPI